MNSGFKWMFLILGTIIGAGYASGRELWQFFGFESGLAIVIFTVIFIIAVYVIMKISYEVQSDHFFPILERLVGKKLSYVYDFLIVLYLFTTTIVMIAGGGATLEAFSIPYWAGITLFAVLLVLLFVGSSNGIIKLNSIIIPMLVFGLFYALLSFNISHHHSWVLDLNEQYNWPAAFTFTALNILPLIAVLSAIGKEIKSLKEAKVASIGSGVILGTISFVYNETLIQMADYLTEYEIPLFAVLKGSPFGFFLFMSVMLWLAIYTTAVSGIFGLASRFKQLLKVPFWLIALILVLAMLPFTRFGFANLVGILYPLYGLINLYLLVTILLYPILNRYRTK
ncbi:GerAB/ArcD/ProY family transporter [Metabacillus litoralis]|uniref:YkvI family membrane protein n=1 Tax=Metabacillus TaxID=2675233 RepID=UPI000EF562D8|nr:GerAB/ArcD/ProY family transporter [Metabacillus litoralis]MCM3164405.1 GerAB/ArcD/ProY family transporter [Metabacillus litoralis]MCM3411160.1 GerAB/ArcD/ProY family transporter [Metabacillus litoralis]UHA61095.1 GerAB/ArcD/ProY family transporter [Metabacillus litoralis]